MKQTKYDLNNQTINSCVHFLYTYYISLDLSLPEGQIEFQNQIEFTYKCHIFLFVVVFII